MNQKQQTGKRKGILVVLILLGCLLIAFLLKIFFGSQEGRDSKRKKGGQYAPMDFVYYEGPILPATSDVEQPELEVERQIKFSIPIYDGKRGNRLQVRETYSIRNQSAEDKSFLFSFPYQGDFRGGVNEFKALVDGEPADMEFFASHPFPNTDEKGYAKRYANPEEFRKLLGTKDFFEEAHSEWSAKDPQIQVYELTDIEVLEELENPEILLIMSGKDPSSRLWSAGFNSYEFEEDGRYLFGRSLGYDAVLEEDGSISPSYLSVLGGGQEKVEVKGRFAVIEETDQIRGKVVKKTMPASRFIDLALDTLFHPSESFLQEGKVGELIRAEFLQSLSQEDREEGSAQYIAMEDIQSQILLSDRMLYQETELNLPAGKTVEITLQYLKEPSFDYGGFERAGLYGYDLETTLGSNFHFTKTTVELETPELFEFERENFGFTEGKTKVELDPEQTWYYMEIKQ